jgi:hypothetical protein
VLPALATAAVLAVAVPALTSCTGASTTDHGSALADRQPGAGSPTSPLPDHEVEEVTSLVKQRFAAVERGDRGAWLAALSPDVVEAERVAQGKVFDRMRAMGVTDLRVVSVGVLGVLGVLGPAAAAATPIIAPAPGTARAATSATSATSATPATAPSAAVRARLTATYRLDGFDTAPRTFVVDLIVDRTARRTPDHALDGTPDAAATIAPTPIVTPTLRSWDPAERLQPWDLDGLRVRRTADALLLVVGPDSRLDELTRRIRVADQQVAAVWGRSEPSVWVAPGTDDDAARLLGRSPEAMAQVAAVTDGPLVPGERAGADRIVVAPSPWTRLSGVGRDVVLTHELTHASVRAATTRSVPDWLAEGFAELVAYRGVDLPERVAVAPALALVRREGLPTALPTDADFDPAGGRLEAAYGLSLLAVRELADRQGTAALVRVYREAAGGLAVPSGTLGDAEAVTDLALARNGTDRAGLVREWRDRIASLLSP